MRSVLVKATVLSVALALASAALVSCSSNDKNTVAQREDLGSAGLNLQIAPGIDVSVVTYTISGNGITPITGSIPVTDPAANVSVLVGGLPAGSGYSITLDATSTDGQTDCAGTAGFSVIAGQTTNVSVDLICDTAQGRGAVNAQGNVDNCPEITYYVAAPLQVSVGGQIVLNAAAVDADSGALTFAWTSTLGSFTAPGSAATNFNCDVAGTPTLTLTVGDGLCTDTASFNVQCISFGCGNGTVEGQETCDDGNTVGGDACPADCTLPVCGDSVIESAGAVVENCDDGNQNNGDNCPNDCSIAVCGDGSAEGPEQCDPPNGTTCNQLCRNIVCGDGTVEAPEQCEPPNTASCSASCQSIQQVVCGDGTVTAPEQCEGPMSGNTCDDDCQSMVSAACYTCETTVDSDGDTLPDCEAYAAPNQGCDAPILAGDASTAGGAAPNTPKRTLCYQAFECLRETGCANGPTGVTGCYCGSTDATSCFLGSTPGDGACKTIIEQSMESLTPSVIVAQRFGNPSFAGGMAMLRGACEKATCAGICTP